jgi:ankyrin repeat protein
MLWAGHDEVARMLLRHHADVLHRDADGMTALMYPRSGSNPGGMT